MWTNYRLERVYRQSDIISVSRNGSYVFFSDCHRGTGNWNDNFAANQNLAFRALKYYYDHGFTCFELGDGDELWENRSPRRIIESHSDIYWMMRRFYQRDRYYMLWGNHDDKKKNKNFVSHHYATFFNECSRKEEPLFPDLKIREGLRLKFSGEEEIFLVHGHHGSLMNDYLAPLTKFLIRYIWKPLEQRSFKDPTIPANNYKVCKRSEERLRNFASEKGVLIMTGHTHRPVLQRPNEGRYINDGSMVHPRCITTVELTNGYLNLVKWAVCSKSDGTLFINREILDGPERLSDYFQQV